MYQVKLSNQAEKDLKKLDKIYRIDSHGQSPWFSFPPCTRFARIIYIASSTAKSRGFRFLGIKVAKYIDFLAENPLLGEKMEGQFKGWFRVKIPPLRIIYTQDAENKIIWIKAIGHRGNVYK